MIDRADTARSIAPLCHTCGQQPRERHHAYCIECRRAHQREAYKQEKSVRKRCDACGQSLPHKSSHGCPVTVAQRGRERINIQWPGYGDLLTDQALLWRAGLDWPHVRGYPPPSRLFVGLHPSLDARLIREKRDKDVSLCQAVAAVAADDQRDFLELFLVDPADARHWAALPRWKRPIRKGDADDIAVWKFFTMQRLNMEQAATGTPWALASQGAQLPQMFGAVARLSLAGVQKLVAVMNGFGLVLQQGRDPGNVMKKPWDR